VFQVYVLITTNRLVEVEEATSTCQSTITNTPGLTKSKGVRKEAATIWPVLSSGWEIFMQNNKLPVVDGGGPAGMLLTSTMSASTLMVMSKVSDTGSSTTLVILNTRMLP
jgi:hypothetical protein